MTPATISGPLSDVLSRLKGLKRSGSGYMALCPCHDDHNPSLSITEDGGKVLLHCHAGCTYEAIATELGLNHTAPAGKPESYQGNPIVKWYPYRDEQGRVLYEVARIQKGSDKDFRPYCRGQFKLNGQQRVLYRLPELIKAPADDWVFLCEGEKDSDNVACLGLVATTNVFGGLSWEQSYTPYFKDRRVCILNDNDDTGRQRAAKLMKELTGTTKQTRTLDLPNLPEKGDVSNWLDAGGTKDQLIALVEKKETIPLLSCSDIETEPIEWLWDNRIPAGMFSMIVGDPGIGKSFLSIYLSSVITTGRDWADGCKSNKGSVFFFADEDDFPRVVVPRLIMNGADVKKVYCLNELIGKNALFNIADVTHLTRLEQAIEQVGDCRMIVLDPVTAYMGDVNANNNAEVRAALSGIVRLAQKTGVAVVAISHLNKKADLDAMYRALGSMGFVAQARAVWGVVKDKTDDSGETRIFSPIKCNLSVKIRGLSYVINDGVVAFDSEPVEENIDQTLTASPATDAAMDFLNEILAGGALVEQTYIQEQADSRGIKSRTLNRAKKKLGVESVPQQDKEGRKHWFWRVKG